MKTPERHRLNRYDSIAQVLTRNRAVVAQSRELSFSTSKFCKIIEAIRKKQKEFNSQLQAGQLRSLKLKDELILILTAVSSALCAFSKKTENPELRNAARLNQKELFGMDENLLIAKSVNIYGLAERYCHELKEYNINKNSLQFLKNKTEEFKEALNENRVRYYFLHHSVLKLDELFMQADEILKNIDGYVELLGGSCCSEFSRDYLNTRYTRNS